MKVSKGLGTYAGLITAFAQYLAAVALFLEADDQALALGPLATATLTLYKVLDGRFNQATALIENPKVPAKAVADLVSGSIGGNVGTGTTGNVTWTSPRPGAEMTNVPAGSFIRGAQTIDEDEPGDPDALPEYETTEDVPPDEGDEHARPEATP